MNQHHTSIIGHVNDVRAFARSLRYIGCRGLPPVRGCGQYCRLTYDGGTLVVMASGAIYADGDLATAQRLVAPYVDSTGVPR